MYIFPAYPTSLPGLPLHFINTDIVFLPSCTFLGISVSSHDIYDRNIPQSVQKLYCRSNEVMSDFKSLSRNVKSQLFSTFCLDAYGSQLWPFLITLLNRIILHGERLLGKLGACLSLFIVVFFHTINNSLPIDAQLEIFLLKCLHSCLNSSNEVFLCRQSNKVFQHLVRIIVIGVINIRLCLICLDQISPL